MGHGVQRTRLKRLRDHIAALRQVNPARLAMGAVYTLAPSDGRRQRSWPLTLANVPPAQCNPDPAAWGVAADPQSAALRGWTQLLFAADERDRAAYACWFARRILGLSDAEQTDLFCRSRTYGRASLAEATPRGVVRVLDGVVAARTAFRPLRSAAGGGPAPVGRGGAVTDREPPAPAAFHHHQGDEP